MTTTFLHNRFEDTVTFTSENERIECALPHVSQKSLVIARVNLATEDSDEQPTALIELSLDQARALRDLLTSELIAAYLG